MSLATVDDLGIYLARTFDDTEAAQAEMMLEQATAMIQAFTQQAIEYVKDDTAELWGTWATRLELPERPVVDVTAVHINGIPVADWVYDGKRYIHRGFLDYSLPAQLQFGNISVYSNFGGPQARVTVTYSHGYETIPSLLVAVCCSVAARRMSNPAGIMASENSQHFNVSYGGSQANGLLPFERQMLRSAGFKRSQR